MRRIGQEVIGRVGEQARRLVLELPGELRGRAAGRVITDLRLRLEQHERSLPGHPIGERCTGDAAPHDGNVENLHVVSSGAVDQRATSLSSGKIGRGIFL